MDYRFDEKGKYYTMHVNKRTTAVLVFAQGLLISGTMHLVLDNRVKDELNGGERYVALTHAQVRELGSGKIVVENETVILNKDQIVWIIPHEEIHESENLDTSAPA